VRGGPRQLGLVDRLPDVHGNGVHVCKVEGLQAEEQVGAVEAAAEHGHDGGGFVGERGELLEAFDEGAAGAATLLGRRCRQGDCCLLLLLSWEFDAELGEVEG
jgi:hypothetical protein